MCTKVSLRKEGKLVLFIIHRCVRSQTPSRSRAFKEQFQTVLFGTVDVTNTVLPYMRARKEGRIILIGSRSAWFPEFVVGYS